jgi:hypothetical protein
MIYALLIVLYMVPQLLHPQQISLHTTAQSDPISSDTHILTNLTAIETELRDLKSSENQYIVAAVAAAGAIGGGFMTSYVSARREERKQQILDKEEAEFNRNIRRLLISELQTYQAILYYILKDAKPLRDVLPNSSEKDRYAADDAKQGEVDLMYKMFQLPTRYSQLKIARIGKVFKDDDESFAKTEAAYRGIMVGIEFIYQSKHWTFSKSKVDTLLYLISEAMSSNLPTAGVGQPLLPWFQKWGTSGWLDGAVP